MSNFLTTFETALWLKERNRFLIITHRRPDGDTLGSAGALAQGLREQGKTAYILYNPEVTPRYERFVEQYVASDKFIPDHIIVVDTASTDLFTENAKKYTDSVSLCIDHHKSNNLYADNTCLYAEIASCGEIIYDILMEMSGNISTSAAERLYVALSTDTGCFVFGNTTANTLYVASRLVKAGVRNNEINKVLFRTKSQGRIGIEGLLLSGLEYTFDGKVAMASITKKMIEETGATEDDMDDIAAIPGVVKGVCIGITIREMSSQNDCKLSVRSRSPYDAQAICAHFGGGGHKLAAGCTIDKTIPEIKKMLLDIIKGQMTF